MISLNFNFLEIFGHIKKTVHTERVSVYQMRDIARTTTENKVKLFMLGRDISTFSMLVFVDSWCKVFLKGDKCDEGGFGSESDGYLHFKIIQRKEGKGQKPSYYLKAWVEKKGNTLREKIYNKQEVQMVSSIVSKCLHFTSPEVEKG